MSSKLSLSPRTISGVSTFRAALVFAVLAEASPSTAAITLCSQLCPGSGSTCSVQTSIDIVAGSFLDCPGKDISIAGSGKLTVNGGSFALSASSLTIGSGRTITADPSSSVPVGMEIDLTGAFTSSGKIFAQNGGGGSFVAIQAGDAINLSGGPAYPSIDVSGSANSCDGGEVYLSSGSSIAAFGRIDVNGKDGGDEFNVNAGGFVELIATGGITVGQEIRASGRFFDGGSVRIVAGGTVLIDYRTGSNLPKGAIDVEGRNIDGYGGYVDIAAPTITVSGPIKGGGGMNSSGGYGAGAEVFLDAGCGGVVIEDSIDLTGGDDGGGILNVQSDGPIQVSTTIDARSRRYNGDGGIVVLTSGKLLTMAKTAVVNVDGHNTPTSGENGAGGVFRASGCQVNLADDATTGTTISAQGYRGGIIRIEGAKGSLSSTDYSVRVGNKTWVVATGEASQGSHSLLVTQRRLGTCSTNAAVTCQTNLQCPAAGVCNNANPDTQGSLEQFQPTPSIAASSSLAPCNTTCP